MASPSPKEPMISLVFKCLAAPFVCFFISWVVFLGILVFAFLHLWPIGAFLVFPLVGFCGVLSGTLCLPRFSRRVGATILLLLSLAFYLSMASALDHSPDDV